MLRGGGLDRAVVIAPGEKLDTVRLYMACVVFAGVSSAVFGAILSDRRKASVPIVLLALFWMAVYWV